MSRSTLTVVLVPAGVGDELVAVLEDYAAAGLLTEFICVAGADIGGRSTPATLISSAGCEPVLLEHRLTEARYALTRLAVVVPLDKADGQRVPTAAEKAVEQAIRSSADGGAVVLLRVLLTRGSDRSDAANPALVLEGWHNLLVAPEESAGPGIGTVPWDLPADSLELAQRAAPVVASVAGLWAGIAPGPFDSVQVLPGQTVRSVRAYYRCLDTWTIEEGLRSRLFDPDGRLPLPRSGQTPIVAVADPGVATQTMAQALWRKHRGVLRGPRMALPADVTTAVSTWEALKVFLNFLWAALRQAPSAWLAAVRGAAGNVAAATVQSAAFGTRDSAYAVVADTRLVSWQDVARSAETLTQELGGVRAEYVAQQDLSALWTDFIAGALTLADGGRRAVGLDPVAIGPAIGVLANATDVVPSPADDFRGVPTSLAAVVGVSSVSGADVAGQLDLAVRLQSASADPAVGVAANTAAADLQAWQATVGRSYAYQTAKTLIDFLGRARKEIEQCVHGLRGDDAMSTERARLLERQRVIGLTLKILTGCCVAGLLAFVGVGAVALLSWKTVAISSAVTLVTYALASVVLFLVIQRDLFAEMHLRQRYEGRVQVLEANLRTALIDVTRLSMAYGQLLAWCRALGPVLRAPNGPAPQRRPQPGQISAGLPRSVRLATAAPDRQQISDAGAAIERELYAVGWLSGPWDGIVAEGARALRVEPEALFGEPGAGSGSHLDIWSAAIASGEIHPTGGDALWSRVQQTFSANGDAAAILTGAVQVSEESRPIAERDFSAGITDRCPAAPFNPQTFSPGAATAGQSVAVINDPRVARVGLGYRAVVVQASDGLPCYEFAAFAPSSGHQVADNGLGPFSSTPETTPGPDLWRPVAPPNDGEVF